MNDPLSAEIARMMLRELTTVRDELDAYPEWDLIWARPEGAPNSAGNLALHLAGNLQHFVGAGLGATGYQRDREGEFGRTGLSRDELFGEIQNADNAIRQVLLGAGDGILEGDFPIKLGDRTLPTRAFVLHLAAHLAYHLGQIDYHRRLTTGDVTSVGALSPFATVAEGQARLPDG